MTSLAPSLTSLTGTYTIDTAHSRIGFVARYAMATKVRGAFNEFDGTADLDGSDPSRSSARVTISATSIDTRNAQRDGHLRTGDFLDVERYPTITFVSTGVRHHDEVFELIGDLTVKDVTRQVTIPFTFEGLATDPYGNVRAGFEGSLAVSRKEFGLTWNAPLETGGVLVGDKVVLELEISAVRNP